MDQKVPKKPPKETFGSLDGRKNGFNRSFGRSFSSLPFFFFFRFLALPFWGRFFKKPSQSFPGLLGALQGCGGWLGDDSGRCFDGFSFFLNVFF